MADAKAFIKDMIVKNLGPIVLGVVVNTYLYGIVTFQYASYWTTPFDDPLWIKATVLMLFLLDTMHSTSLMWMLWHLTVNSFSDLVALSVPVWPHPLTIAVTALSAFVTQFFLSYRTYRLTRGKLLYFGSIVVEVGTLFLGIVTAVKGFEVKSFASLPALKPYLSAWLCLEMAIDVVLCCLLLYTLSKSRTGFARSDTVIRRLMRAAVQTGCFATTFALVTLVLFFAIPNTQIFSVTGIPISRVYSNMLMDTILCRGELRDMLDQDRGVSTQNTLTGIGTSSFAPSVQLQIHKEVHTHVRYEGRDNYPMRPSQQRILRKQQLEQEKRASSGSQSTDLDEQDSISGFPRIRVA